MQFGARFLNIAAAATGDNTFALTTPSGANVPAPWVPFTRAGCDVGAFSTANIVLERTPFDVQKVFGANSTQAAKSGDDQTNDFIGGDSLRDRQPFLLCGEQPGGGPATRRTWHIQRL